MEITHRDRNGNYWRFVINCPPQQGEQIRRTLAGVRNMGNRAALSISAIIDADANGPLYAEFENAVLQGLAARFPADQERRTPQPVQGGKPKRPVFDCSPAVGGSVRRVPALLSVFLRGPGLNQFRAK